MNTWNKLRGSAWLCALAVLVCLLISRPYADTGVVDDWSYIRTAQLLADTGQVHYNGWGNPLLGWQLYFAAALIKLFGFSFTVVRVSTWLVALATAFLLQRVLVRCGASERNAMFGTLALVLSPLFMVLSSVYMTDMQGMLALVLCLYGCLRALDTVDDRRAAAWIVFAVASNAIIGTSRQIAWLGLLVMVPSTLWLLRRRTVLLAGLVAVPLGTLFILGCLHWAYRQPYFIHEPLFKATVSNGLESLPDYPQGMLLHVLRQFVRAFVSLPVLLPTFVLFIPALFRRRSWGKYLGLACVALLVLLAFHWRHSHPDYLLEPTVGNFLGSHGLVEIHIPLGLPPVVLGTGIRLLLSALAFAAFWGFFTVLTGRTARESQAPPAAKEVRLAARWKTILVLLVPFSLVYALLLIPRSALELYDRYTLPLLLLPLIVTVRVYQDDIQPRMPAAMWLVFAVFGGYSICFVHNTYALSRALLTTDQRLHAAGVPQNQVDFAWDYDATLELQHYPAVDESRITNPAGVFEPMPVTVDPKCWKPLMLSRYVHPRFGVSFDPGLCSGRTSFVPETYRVWPTGQIATLYVVNYTPLNGHW